MNGATASSTTSQAASMGSTYSPPGCEPERSQMPSECERDLLRHALHRHRTELRISKGNRLRDELRMGIEERHQQAHQLRGIERVHQRALLALSLGLRGERAGGMGVSARRRSYPPLPT